MSTSSPSSGSRNSNNPGKVAVIGGTGRLGRLAVQQLHNRGIQCNVLVRKTHPSSSPTVTSSLPTASSEESHVNIMTMTKDQVLVHLSSLNGVHLVEGDVTDVTSLDTLLDGCTACLALFGATRRSRWSDLRNSKDCDSDPTHSKAVNYQGVANLIQAAKLSNTCKRIIRITGKGETPNSFFSILINMLGSMAKAWNYEGERLLRDQQDVDYTIIRPGIMSENGPDGPYSLSLADDGGDLPVSKIRYADIATLAIDCLMYPNAARSTLTAMTTITNETIGTMDSYAPLLNVVQPDRRSFPTDMMEQHSKAVRKTLYGLGITMLFLVSAMFQTVLRFL